jgi:hypothetical protein
VRRGGGRCGWGICGQAKRGARGGVVGGGGWLRKGRGVGAFFHIIDTGRACRPRRNPGADTRPQNHEAVVAVACVRA